MLESRDYQQRIVKKVMAAIENGHKNILIESPTGSGKTVTGHIILGELYKKHGWNATWTAMRKHLIVQAKAENESKFKYDFIKYISTFNDAPPHSQVLVIDEAQHSPTVSANDFIRKVSPIINIGTTATPFRTDRMKLCYSTIIKDAGIRSLIDQKWMPPYHHYTFNDDWTPANVANVYLSHRKLWGKSIIFFLTEIECNAAADIIRNAGYRAEVVTGSSDQESQIESFVNDDDLNVLLNMVVLTEGFDFDRLKTVFVRPGSKGPTQQMCGRVFRKHKDKPHAIVVQNDETHWPFTKIASCEEKWFMNNGEWQRRDLNLKIDKVLMNSLIAIAGTTVELPAHLKSKKLRDNEEFIGAIDNEW